MTTFVFSHARAATLASCLILAGCFPAVWDTYYKPVADEGQPRYSGNICQGATGAPVSMRLDLANGLELGVSTRRGAADTAEAGLHVSLALSVRQGARVRWTEPVLRIDDDAGREHVFQPLWQVTGMRRLPADGAVQWQQLAPVPSLFAPGTPIPQGFAATLGTGFTWNDFRPEQVEVSLPGLVAQGAASGPQVFRLQGVREDVRQLSSVRKTITYRTAELAERLRVAQVSCRGSDSERANCLESARLRHETFELAHGPLALSGRWWVFERDRPDPLRGSLSLEFKVPLDVAWQAERIRVRSLDTNATPREHSIPLGSFVARTRFAAPLTAEIVGSNEAADSFVTRAALEVRLGLPERSRYVIRLPAIEVDGRTVNPKPVVLELRRLDFGILPFNC